VRGLLTGLKSQPSDTSHLAEILAVWRQKTRGKGQKKNGEERDSPGGQSN